MVNKTNSHFLTGAIFGIDIVTFLDTLSGLSSLSKIFFAKYSDCRLRLIINKINTKLKSVPIADKKEIRRRERRNDDR